MAVEKIETVKPTRMELLEITRKRLLAEKGHRLLTEKRDALVVQFFQIIETRKELREELEKDASQAYKRLREAEMRYGTSAVTSMAMGAQTSDNIDGTVINIMGVPVPHLELHKTDRGTFPYNPFDGGAYMDAASRHFLTTLETVVRLAEAEGTLERMALEIEKTKRRVNALENVFIPRLKATERYISMQLEEREREDFFRRKRIKALMEKDKIGKNT